MTSVFCLAGRGERVLHIDRVLAKHVLEMAEESAVQVDVRQGVESLEAEKRGLGDVLRASRTGRRRPSPCRRPRHKRPRSCRRGDRRCDHAPRERHALGPAFVPTSQLLSGDSDSRARATASRLSPSSCLMSQPSVNTIWRRPTASLAGKSACPQAMLITVKTSSSPVTPLGRILAGALNDRRIIGRSSHSRGLDQPVFWVSGGTHSTAEPGCVQVVGYSTRRLDQPALLIEAAHSIMAGTRSSPIPPAP